MVSNQTLYKCWKKAGIIDSEEENLISLTQKSLNQE
jgi:hypothetical protein